MFAPCGKCFQPKPKRLYHIMNTAFTCRCMQVGCTVSYSSDLMSLLPIQILHQARAALSPEQRVCTIRPVLGPSRSSLDGPAVAPVGSVVVSRPEGLAAFLVVLLSNTSAAAAATAAAAGHRKLQVVATPLVPPEECAGYSGYLAILELSAGRAAKSTLIQLVVPRRARIRLGSARL
jgi:hypothetical protein